MKSLIISFLLVICFSFQSTSPITPDCKCKDILLKGKVRIVNAFEDFKVRIVPAFEDIRVDTNGLGQRGCGDWVFVTANEDFTIRFVDSFEDFKIRYVAAFHGLHF